VLRILITLKNPFYSAWRTFRPMESTLTTRPSTATISLFKGSIQYAEETVELSAENHDKTTGP
jgi:hypothetical protein